MSSGLPTNASDMEIQGEEVNNSPIEQVRLTVPITDDPTLPVLTFRTWVLGFTSCAVLGFLNQFFNFRTNMLSISSVCAQILVLPAGRLMAAALPTRKIRVPFTKWRVTLNPGPFNLKEHVLITIFASAGAGGVYAVYIITALKAFYRRDIHPFAAFLLALTTQMLGYGWAGMFRKYLVDSPYMWWPSNLVQVSLFRALHEEEKRPKGGMTRLQFFLLVFAGSFCYYTVPGYLFPSLSSLSFVCWIWKDSILAHQIGSGLNGLGVGSFGLDWTTATMLGSPLATPAFAIFNLMVGFILVMYVLTPITYWTNTFNANRFPIFSPHVYDYKGNPYNITRVLDPKTFTLDLQAYEQYSPINLSIFFAFGYGLGFATLMATLSHVALFHGKSIWGLWKQTAAKAHDKLADVHTRLMKRNYEEVPQWWFVVTLVVVFGLSIWTCEGFGGQLQLPYWGVLLACAMAFFFTLPVGVITATTNQQPGLNIITELVIGYIMPGKPLANVAFKTYGYISMSQALFFLSDFKLGHYMKVPPRSMFFVQLVGTLVACTVCYSTTWWLLSTVESICDVAHLPEGSPWTCPSGDVFYNASIIWGVIGPLRMFGRLGLYSKTNYFFLVGALAPVPVWILAHFFPEKKWIGLINMPIILGATGSMPPVKSVHFITWLVVGIVFNYVVYRKYKGWWARHNYVLSAALDAGAAFMALLIFFSLQSSGVYGMGWWGAEASDHCHLASCPTAPGIEIPGCPLL